MLQIEPVAGNTMCIKTAMVTIPFYHLGNGDIVMMDSGVCEDGDAIIEALDHAGYRIRAILTSHAHFDHVGNHNRFRAYYGARIWSDVYDAAVMQNCLTLKATFHNESVQSIQQAYGYMVCRPDHVIFPEQDWVEIDSAKFRVLQLPGHAHSHMGFVTPDGVAYVADLLLGRQEAMQSKLLFAECWDAALNSMEEACKIKCHCFVLAHGGVVYDLPAVVQANRKALNKQLAVVLQCMDHWMNKQEIMAEAVVKLGVRARNPIRIHVAERTVDAFLDYLVLTKHAEESVQGACLCYRKSLQKQNFTAKENLDETIGNCRFFQNRRKH